MLEILRRIAPLAPTNEMIKVLSANANKLEPFVNNLKKELKMEGMACCCDEGEIGECFRLIHLY